MEQLINTATPYYYAMVAFCVLALGIISVAIIIFICSGATGQHRIICYTYFGNIVFYSGRTFW